MIELLATSYGEPMFLEMAAAHCTLPGGSDPQHRVPLAVTRDAGLAVGPAVRLVGGGVIEPSQTDAAATGPAVAPRDAIAHGVGVGLARVVVHVVEVAADLPLVALLVGVLLVVVLRALENAVVRRDSVRGGDLLGGPDIADLAQIADGLLEVAGRGNVAMTQPSAFTPYETLGLRVAIYLTSMQSALSSHAAIQSSKLSAVVPRRSPPP